MSIDKKCEHPYVEYIGLQTGVEEEPVAYLVNCLDCRTTRAYDYKTMFMLKGYGEYIKELHKQRTQDKEE